MVKITIPTTLIGFDTGESTGIAIVCPNDVRCITVSYDKMLDALAGSYALRVSNIWIVENYVHRPNRDGGFSIPYASQVIGAIDLYARQNGTTVVKQNVTGVKALCSPKMIKELGWKYKTPHELDALRHVLYYLLTKGKENGG